MFFQEKMILILKIFLFLLILHVRPSNEFEDPFETNPDRIMENIMGVDIYQAKANLYSTRAPTLKNFTKIRDLPIFSDNETGQILDTPSNVTERERQFRRVALELESILREQSEKKHKLDPTADHIEETTRRFNTLQEKTKPTRRSFQGVNEPQVNASRRFWPWYPWAFLHAQKPQVYALMQAFIYYTRAKLPFPQAIRKKYLESYRYRIGYIFANIRTIMEQMQWLFNVVYRSFDKFAVYITFTHYLKMFESMIRYDIDVSDLINYLTRLEYDRMMVYNPEYYDERPWQPLDTEP